MLLFWLCLFGCGLLLGLLLVGYFGLFGFCLLLNLVGVLDVSFVGLFIVMVGGFSCCLFVVL